MGKDWRLCRREGCTRPKMFHRTICWHCWQAIRDEVFPGRVGAKAAAEAALKPKEQS